MMIIRVMSCLVAFFELTQDTWKNKYVEFHQEAFRHKTFLIAYAVFWGRMQKNDQVAELRAESQELCDSIEEVAKRRRIA